MTRTERNPRAKQDCIKIHGTYCSVCGFDFGEVYGDIGDGFIEVHHLTPIASQDDEYEIHAEKDLRPVCPNCHRMLHRKTPPYSIDELKDLMKK